MQSFLTEIYANTSLPLLSALLLGLLTAIAPCPLTINITAMGYIGKDISSSRRIFLNGLFYALGTAVSYSTLALVLYFGADQLRISGFFQQHSEKIIGPLLLIIGLVMLGIIPVKIPGMNRLTKRFERRTAFRSWDSFFLGVLLALAFCPYSGVLYFGMLIPLIITHSSPELSLVFSLASAIPIVLFAWLLAFAVSGVGKLFNRIRAFEFWFSKAVALLFIGIGIYYITFLI